MNGCYPAILGGGAVLCTLLFAQRLKQCGLPKYCAAIALPFGIAFGLALSKLLYVLLQFSRTFRRYGFAALLRDKAAEFSFVGGCLGVVLAVALAAHLCRLPVLKTLDAFAPCGALLASVARMGECFLDLVGLGTSVEIPWLQFFPIAVFSEKTGCWMYAVFALEAALALLCAVAGFLCTRKKQFAHGLVFVATLFFLALPQIFSESLRGQCMKWGFVRVEQLLCGFTAFFLLVYVCSRCNGKQAWKAVWACIPCLLMVVAVEFALDKPIFGTYLPDWLCYSVMLLVLLAMSVLALRTFRRMERKG